TAADYEEVLAGHRALVRELDVALNGAGAARQASLCDIVAQVKHGRWKLVRAEEPSACQHIYVMIIGGIRCGKCGHQIPAIPAEETSDAAIGMAWWNNLTKSERAKWMR